MTCGGEVNGTSARRDCLPGAGMRTGQLEARVGEEGDLTHGRAV